MSVLIVDDDAAFRQALEQDLRQSGYAVCAASGLDSALNAMPLAHQRVAIVDAHLPCSEVRTLVSRSKSLRHPDRAATGARRSGGIGQAHRVSRYPRKKTNREHYGLWLYATATNAPKRIAT